MRLTWLSVLLASVAMVTGAATPTTAQSPKGPAAATSVAPAKVELAAAERDLLADIEDGEFRTLSFADASLIASGVTDTGKRKVYLVS